MARDEIEALFTQLGLATNGQPETRDILSKTTTEIVRRARWAFVKAALLSLGCLAVTLATLLCVVLGCLKLFGVI